eukprot:TRINITY_DN10074_c0_g1_i4.p1 TRINITY_DN10074_c0_g1~~TRINITY_DN10074_c0_g1_i4.p1  ORF type:complete len:276 (-),score=24.18 TRINITY_DN10074_c0_g1_i4:74-901(-)
MFDRTVYRQIWRSRSVKPKALVIYVHGLNSHSGKMARHVVPFAQEGIVVCGVDMLGHGRSDGIHGYVSSMEIFLEDLHSHILQVSSRSEYSELPLFLMGQSMGGLICMQYLRKHPSTPVRGFISLASLIQLSNPPSIPMVLVSKLLHWIFPEMPLLPPNPDPVKSRAFPDYETLHDERSDPLAFNGFLRIGTAVNLYNSYRDLQKNLHAIQVPMLVFHGDDDGTTHHEGSLRLVAESKSSDKKMVLLPKARHILFREKCSHKIMTDSVAWILERC